MSQVFETLCCFSRIFLKQFASPKLAPLSADTLQLKFTGIKLFLVHPEN